MKHWSTLTVALISAAVALSHQANSNQDNHKGKGPTDRPVIGSENNKDTLIKGTIVLEAFQIVDGDSDEVLLKMDKDGKCYLNADFIGTITAAGEIKSDKGEVVARIEGDKLMTSENKVLVTIKADGTISDGSAKDFGWGPDGFLTGKEIGLKLIPADSKAKIAASMLLTAFMGFGITE